MTHTVYLTDDAVRDLEEIHDFVAAQDAPEKADKLLTKIENLFNSLSTQSHRGRFPKELIITGLKDFREVSFKPYRVVYRVVGKNVYILLIADGRRDMQTMLQQRLLRE